MTIAREARGAVTADNALPAGDSAPALRRALSLPLLVLYGLGVMIGAGIYVLIGATAERAGLMAPFAFVLAAIIIAPTAASFAELGSRFPVSAGEAAFVREAFRSRALSLLVGANVVLIGVVSAAAIALGAVGYIREFTDLPEPLITAALLILLGAIAAYGILESVSFAALLTLIEIGGLLLVVGAGLLSDEPAIVARLGELVPDASALASMTGIFGAMMIAVFAFIGFEDLVNVAEEAHMPERALPWATFLALGITALLYVLVSAVAVLGVPLAELAASRAPLSLVMSRVGHLPPSVISAIAVIATVNGVIVQIIMASRVIYGMARQGVLPAALGRVSGRTRTPLLATVGVTAVIALLALFVPFGTLAENTARLALVSFTLVNLALVRIKRTRPAPGGQVVSFGMWVPVLGVLTCIGLLAADAIVAFGGAV